MWSNMARNAVYHITKQIIFSFKYFHICAKLIVVLMIFFLILSMHIVGIINTNIIFFVQQRSQIGVVCAHGRQGQESVAVC